MRIVVELTDASESTARNLEVLLFEELSAHLRKRNFNLEMLRIVEELKPSDTLSLIASSENKKAALQALPVVKL